MPAPDAPAAPSLRGRLPWLLKAAGLALLGLLTIAAALGLATYGPHVLATVSASAPQQPAPVHAVTTSDQAQAGRRQLALPVEDALLARRAEFEAARPLANSPPAPAWAALQPGLEAASYADALERFETLADQTQNLSDPAQPWNQNLTQRITLSAIDGHIRHNPSWRVATAANETLFVKFPCIPGAKGLDASGACKDGMPLLWESTPKRHLDSIQSVSDFCGFGPLKARTWSAPVVATTPEGFEIKGQLGFFAQWLHGKNPEHLNKELKRQWINSIPVEWVWWGALHDLIMCESDRHQANIVIQPDQTFRLIDNDHELNNRFGYGSSMLTAKDGTCMPSSLFFPHNLESWRVWRYRLPLARLDFRCHSGPDVDVPLPRRIRSCLSHFANSTAAEMQEEFGILRLDHAESLKERATDLLDLGFWQALLRQVDRHAAGFWQEPSRLAWADRMFPHWRRSLWRPLQAPLCDFSRPYTNKEIHAPIV